MFGILVNTMTQCPPWKATTRSGRHVPTYTVYELRYITMIIRTSLLGLTIGRKNFVDVLVPYSLKIHFTAFPSKPWSPNCFFSLGFPTNIFWEQYKLWRPISNNFCILLYLTLSSVQITYYLAPYSQNILKLYLGGKPSYTPIQNNTSYEFFVL